MLGRGLFLLYLAIPSLAFSSAQWPNEPAGSTVINDWGHDSLSGNGWYDVYGGYTSSIVNDATAPLSPSTVLQQKFAKGLVGGNGGGGGSLFSFGNSYPSVYWGFWVKTDPDYEQHPVTTKIGWIHTRIGNTPSTNNLVLNFDGKPFGVSLNYQQNDIDNSQVPGGNFGTIKLYANSGFIQPGTWARVETCFQQSTTNTSQNGIWKLWVDGTLVHNVTNLNTDRIFPDAVSHITIWGGTGAVKTRDSFIYWDHEHISTGPGCSGTGSSGGSLPPIVLPALKKPTNLKIL